MIEHNLDVIRSADWVIDLGPEGGDGGGKVVAQGTPEEIAKNKNSHTGRFLKTANVVDMNQTTHPEAGIHLLNRHQMRYWDGTEWTSHVSDGGQTSVDEEGKALANTGQTVSTGLIDGEMFGYTTPEQVQAQVAKAQTSSSKDSILNSIDVPQPSATDVPPPSYDQSIFAVLKIFLSLIKKQSLWN